MAKTLKHVTADDIRHFLLDRDAGDNYLHDAVEFDDPTILKAMEYAVDLYNTTLPLVTAYTVESFPFRAEMIMGAAAYCLRSKAINLARNDLPTTTQGGTQVRDKAKANDYLALAHEISKEFKDRIVRLKRTANESNAWRIVH